MNPYITIKLAITDHKFEACDCDSIVAAAAASIRTGSPLDSAAIATSLTSIPVGVIVNTWLRTLRTRIQTRPPASGNSQSQQPMQIGMLRIGLRSQDSSTPHFQATFARSSDAKPSSSSVPITTSRNE